MASRVEGALSNLVTAFEALLVANGYRNDVCAVYKQIRTPEQIIDDYPEIGIEFGEELMTFEDTGWTVLDSFVDVRVVGVVRSDADPATENTSLRELGESFLADMKVILFTLAKTYLTSSSNRWIIMPSGRNLIRFRRTTPYMEQKNLMAVEMNFTIKVFALDSSQDD
jgi:hypothetical protein